MKIAVIIFAILGALAAIGGGSKWLSDYNKYQSTLAELEAAAKEHGNQGPVAKQLSEINQVRNASYALIPLGVIALITSFMIGRIGGKACAGILLACAVIPGMLTANAFFFTSLIFIGGILAFFVKPKVQPVAITTMTNEMRRAA